MPSVAEWCEEDDFTLSMSAGFMGFFAHAGFLKALREKGLAPTAGRGSSAGGLIVGADAAGVEPGKMAEELANLQREDFWDPAPGFGLLRGLLRSLLPVTEFSECRIPLEVSVFDVKSREKEIRRQGDLALALHATCAFPGLLQPVDIDGRPKLDGGIKDWAGLADSRPDERILHLRLNSRLSRYIPGNSQSRQLIIRPNMQIVEVEGIPPVTPFSLHKGMEAYRIAEKGMLHALDQPVAGDLV